MKKIEVYLSIFLFLISFFVILVLVFPKYQSLPILKNDVLQKKSEYENLENYHQQLREISEKLENYKEPLSKIDFALPENPSLPEFFNFIQNLTSLSGLSLEEIGSTLMGGERLKEWKIILNLKGDYPAFKNFLSSLEKSARLIEIDKISFSSLKEKELFNFNLEIKIRGY